MRMRRVVCSSPGLSPCGGGEHFPRACASRCKSLGTRGILHRPSAHAVRGNRLEPEWSSPRGWRGRVASGVFPAFLPSRSPWQPRGGCRVRRTGEVGRMCAHAPPEQGFPSE